MHEKARGRTVAWAVGCAAVITLGVATWRAWPHIVFRWRFEPLGRNAKGFLEYRHRKTGIVLVRVPGGTFQMGRPESEDGTEGGEGPVHAVTLSPFLISKYEVTQPEWEGVMGSNPSHFKGDNLPVETVSWDDCQAFCRKTGLKLPTEAEWEYACRAGTSGPYAGTGKLDAMGWYTENSGGTTHPVGRKLPNGFGIHDMHGNVFEWCQDVYDVHFYSKADAAGHDPVCTSGSRGRVIRGGSWINDDWGCRSANRFRDDPKDRFSVMGFRPSASSP